MLVDDVYKSQLLGISYGEYMALKKDFYINVTEVDDIYKSQLLGISYGEYMELKKDFYSNDLEKALKATTRMAKFMEKASRKLKEEKEN